MCVVKRPLECRKKSGSAGSVSSTFCFPYNSVTIGQILFKCGRCMSSPGEFFGICCSDISNHERGHMTENTFFRWVSLSG